MTTIHETSDDDSVRYVLGEIGKKNLICFGVNPSTATPDNPDPTIKSVKRFVENHGYDGWIMLNLYPLRCTKPDNLPKEMDEEIHRKNIGYINKILKIYPNSTCWAAWGTLVEKRDYLKQCLQDIYSTTQKYDITWIRTGALSLGGHPHHPLYLKNECEVKEFLIERYIKIL